MLLSCFENKVDFSAEGPDTEKLLNYCAEQGIEITGINKKGFVLSGSVAANRYKTLRIPARKFGIRLKIIKKKGTYFFIKKNYIKAGAVFGFIFVSVIVLFLNMFIWEINIYGNKKVLSENIIASAKEMGLNRGTLSKKHDVQTIEWHILNENEGLALVEINIQGSCANITVRETSEPAEMKSDDDVPVNIIASRYGVIRKMDVFDGQDNAKVGDAVMKGDLLVSAVYEDRHNKLTLKHARANIIAETDYYIKIEFPLKQKLEYKGNLRKKVLEIDFMGMVFKIGNNKKTDRLIAEREEMQLRFLWIKLPVNLIITRYFDVKQKDITYNFEQGKAGAYLFLEQQEKIELDSAEIISRTNTERIKDEKYIIEANYIVLMNIAEEQPLESDIPWENTDDIS